MQDTVNILLVDDDDRNLDALEAILENPGYHLVRTRNADQTLLAVMAADFAVIVMDIHMPDMSGLELAQIIKQRKKSQHVPIIFLTAYYREDEHVMQGYGAGAVDYLNKPCNPAILRSKVEVFVDLFRKSRALEIEIVERRQAAQRERDLNEQLAQRISQLAAANEELESFSRTVGHDLRAPLRQVGGFVNLLGRAAGDSLDPSAAQYIPLIQDSMKRMGKLIDDLLEFSRVGRAELNFRPFQLRQVVDQARHSLMQADSDRKIEWMIDDLPEVSGDSAMLLQVFINVFDNALKFTRNCPVTVIRVQSSIEGDSHVITIKDNGVGFDPQYVGKIFGVFQRLHSPADFEGTGIGLASVQRIVQRHGGRAWAEGVLGQGASIHFSIPILSQTQAA